MSNLLACHLLLDILMSALQKTDASQVDGELCHQVALLPRFVNMSEYQLSPMLLAIMIMVVLSLIP
jgi:hypothetical protein